MTYDLAGERPFLCALCGKQFSDGSKLGKHKKKHEPPKYECEVCQKKFFTSTNLKMHRKTMHDPSRPKAPTNRISKEKPNGLGQKSVLHVATNDASSATSNVSSAFQEMQMPTTSAPQPQHQYQEQNLPHPTYVANGSVPSEHQAVPSASTNHPVNPSRPEFHGHPPRPHPGPPGTEFSGRLFPPFYDPIAHWLNLN